MGTAMDIPWVIYAIEIYMMFIASLETGSVFCCLRINSSNV
jgi:hypothetical protein